MDATGLAQELIEIHERAREVAPFSQRYPGLTPESGYAAARQLHAHRLSHGWKPVGRKIGFTNRTLWLRYGVYESMWGMVYDRTLVWAENGAAAVSLTGLVQPRIEPEICFKLKSAPPTTPEALSLYRRNPGDLLAAIEWLAHSVEIVQCHHPEWKVTIADCTADNGLHGRLIVGAPFDVTSISDLAARLPKISVKLTKGKNLVDEGVGANVLDSPLLSLAFLVDAHAVKPEETWSTSIGGISLSGLKIGFT